MFGFLFLVVYFVSTKGFQKYILRDYPWDNTSTCGNKSYGPVIEGVDVVDIRYVYNKTGNITTPKIGLSKYRSIWHGYEFWFINENNLNEFNKKPEYYIPQWGCYCAWGIAGKCADCLAPQCIAGSCVLKSDGYGFFQNKLYCFMVPGAKNEFAQNVNENIANGNIIWQEILQNNNASYCEDTDSFMDPNSC